mmetsp:Transcript_7866/g.28759  ORF Transcript_7866/g.28759 Transcript_7866/m.28759 type:complete len:154 (+) Transcript_7866:56-517(+)
MPRKPRVGRRPRATQGSAMAPLCRERGRRGRRGGAATLAAAGLVAAALTLLSSSLSFAAAPAPLDAGRRSFPALRRGPSLQAMASEEVQSTLKEPAAKKAEEEAWEPQNDGDFNQAFYYDEEKNIQTLGIDPVTLTAILGVIIVFNFFVLANM